MKTVICIPCMDKIDTVFVESLVGLKHVGEVEHEFIACSLVDKARNDLAKRAVESGADYVLWLDSDMVFAPGLLEQLMADMDGRDIVCGLFHMRKPPFKPCLFKKLRQGMNVLTNEAEDYDDHPTETIFEVEGCGFGCVLMRAKVLKDIRGKYGEPFSRLPGYGEDVGFCIRARGCGYKIHCDPRIEVGHRADTIVTSQTFDAFRKANPEAVKG